MAIDPNLLAQVLGTPADDLAATSAEAYWGFTRTVPAEILAAHATQRV